MTFTDELRAVALNAMNRLSVPGTAIGIISPEGRDVLALGVTALDTRFDVRSDTLFQIGSVSKPFTATLLVAMSESGDLDVDRPVIEYLPEFRLGSQAAASQITARHLLTHQAGFWGDWFEDFGLGDDAMSRFVDHYETLPQQFEPGTMWAYNNCGYILAGYLAARILDKTFEEAVKVTILTPLGLDHTVLSAAEAISYPVAVGHTNDPDDGSARIARKFLRPRSRNPAGGVLSSIEDILGFAELHLGRREGVLSEPALRSMQQPLVETFETGSHWGLGFKIEDYQGGVVVGHGGATNGFRAQLTMVPDQSYAIAVLTNSDSGGRLASEIVDWTLEHRLGMSAPELPTVQLSETDRELLAGNYAQPYGSIEVQRAGAGIRGRLTTHSPYSELSDPHTGEWFGMRYIGDRRFVVTDGELDGNQIKFWRRNDGSIRYLQAGGRLYVPEAWDALERSYE